MEGRQIWNQAQATATTPSSTATRAHCTPFTLPSNGILTFGTSTLTLPSNAVFQPECTSVPDDILLTGSPSSYIDLRDPFYESTLPQCYALAATTVIAYMLFIMLLITPRTFLHQGAVVLGRRGFTNGPSGSDAGIGIGGRPWLQKVAALTVAVSLSIATADTFRVAEAQYNMGIMDAATLQKEVEDGTELKIIRVISDTFLWLAQAQTLIRLFSRQREKIIIKWTAFALISLDALFTILNNFYYKGNSRPHTFVDAVPALAYLFQLALSILYCAWVMYYSLMKKKFAFYHPQMRNICLVAFLSLVAILVPVVFFVLDVSKPTLAAWGDYVRWVGAAAASVVVWEWVERIEALERNDKKDGVLGREVFDGDEMLDVTPLGDHKNGKRSKRMEDKKRGGGTTTGHHGISWPTVTGIAIRYRFRNDQDIEAGTARPAPKITSKGLPLWPTRPPPAATPISRTDTASAESTLYAVRYHPISEATTPLNDNSQPPIVGTDSLDITPSGSVSGEDDPQDSPDRIEVIKEMEGAREAPQGSHQHKPWQALTKVNPFRRKVDDPPPEVSAYRIKPAATDNGDSAFHGWDIRARVEDFAATQAEKFREKTNPAPSTEALTITVIPAPPRRRNLAAALEELGESEQDQRPRSSSGQPGLLSVGLTRVPEPGSPLHSHHPNRVSDPYTPNCLDRQSITQRGAISFATSTTRPSNDPISPVSALDKQNSDYAITPMSTQSSISQIRSPTSGNRNRLPLLSIPAPPRRLKTSDN